MRRITLVIAALLVSTIAASAQSGTFYGPQGQYQGNYSTYGNTTTFYGPTGQYQGTANTYRGTTTFYGPTGQYGGQVQSSSPRDYFVGSPPAGSSWSAPCIFC